ncbi:MAG TPA: hypothetical protein VF760_03080 [Xanthobacteraceae bacterium]
MAFRYDGRVQDISGNAVPTASIAVLTQPANTTTQPGSPLATISAASVQNTPAVSTATWSNLTQQLTFNLAAAPPADVVAGAFIIAAGFTPTGYNGIWQVVSASAVSPFPVVVTTPYTLAAIANPGTVSVVGTFTTSALPNPFFTDQLGNFFFYAAAGIYTVQIFDTLSRITPLVLADQNVVAGSGAGSVTSVSLTMPGEFSVTGSPITASGTLAVSKGNQSANLIYAGPSSGAAVPPTFRALVAADLPAGTGTVTSVGHTLTVPASTFSSTVVGSPITTSGTIADTLTFLNQNANVVFAGPASGAAGQPSWRSLNAQDFPFTTTTLSSAQILALNTTPVTLVAAPGVGFTIIPILIVLKFFGGSSAYTDAGGAVTFQNGSMSATLASNAIFLVTVSPNRRIQSFPWPGATDTAGNPPSDDNAALQITKATNNFAAGNGTATVLTWYYVVPTT